MSAMTLVAQTLRQNFIFKLCPRYLFDSVLMVKEFGLKELLRRRGAKFFFVVIGYYLVRDALLYVLLPYLVARGML